MPQQQGSVRYISIDSTHAITAYFTHNPGVAFLPEYALGMHLEEGTIQKLNVAVPEQFYYTQVLAYRDKWIAPYVTAFLDEIKKERPEVL